MRICFDLDGTILSTEDSYYNAKPKLEVVAFIKKLKDQGHTIIIHTARKMNTYNNNPGKALAKIGTLTFEQLDKYDIVYDEIYFGKPSADFYIDDKAINAKDPNTFIEELNGILNN